MNRGWRYEGSRHALAAKGIKTTTDPKRYFLFKTQESKVMKDDSGIFGWQHKNDAIKTNHRLETVGRRKRIWMDRIEKGIDSGEYSYKLADDFLEDTFKPLEEQYVNGYITREQFEKELESKGEFKLKQYSKKASAFDWAKTNQPEEKKEGEISW